MENIEKKETLVLNNLLIGSSSPHVRSSETVQRIMLDVIIALIPTSIASVYFLIKSFTINYCNLHRCCCI